MKLFKGVIISILSLFVISVMTPLNIYAEPTYGTPFIGVNINIINYDNERVPYQGQVRLETDQTRWHCTAGTSSGCITWQSEDLSATETNDITGQITYNATSSFDAYLYEYDFVLDKSYVGQITFSVNNGLGATSARTYYVNGSHLILTSTSLITSFTVDSYDLNYAPQETINLIKQWNIPIESLAYNYYLFERYNYSGFSDIDYYSYPFFNINKNDYIYSYYSINNISLTLIFAINETITGYNQFISNFDISGHTFISGTNLYNSQLSDGTYFCIYKVNLLANSTGGKNIKYIGQNEKKFIGIYAFRNDTSTPNISTEFALRFGLNNKQLSDLNKLANGNTESSSAVSNNDAVNQQLKQDSNTLFQQEDSFKSNMQSAMQNVPQFSVNSFGSKFMTSAQWVRTQYERMTNNTPFQHLITFSLLVGLSMILIGKVRK